MALSAGEEAANKNQGTYVIERLREFAEGAAGSENSPDWKAATSLYTNFKRLYGREPTQSEVNKIVPYFLQNPAVGNAYLEELKERQDNTPEVIEARKQAELAKKIPQHTSSVNDAFQSLLSRGATQKEVDYFGKLLATGQIDPYELDEFVRQTDEFRTQSDRTFREGLNQELSAYDAEAFGREKENVISRFAQANRLNSPALDFALTDLMGKISSERSRYLAGVSSEQYQGNKGLAREDYAANINRMFGEQDYNRARETQLDDFFRGRQLETGNYLTQRGDYLDAQARAGGQQRPNAAVGAAQGAAAGATLGSSILPGWGTAIGAVGGGAFGYFNSR